MKIIDCAQGTPEWLTARAGIATASNFAAILSKGKGKATKFTEASGIDASFIKEKLRAAGVAKPVEPVRRLK